MLPQDKIYSSDNRMSMADNSPFARSPKAYKLRICRIQSYSNNLRYIIVSKGLEYPAGF